MQRRSYSSTPYKRVGQVNWRQETNGIQKSPPTIKEGTKPDCSIIVTKRKGFGSTGNKESDPMSANGVDYLLKSFPSTTYQRYKVNVYLKR